MSWEALLRELYGLAPRGIQPGLARVEDALARVGDPQRAFEVVHVAGTNGKGSVCAMVAAGLSARRVGLYTSPHLHSLTERFRIDGAPVAREVVIDAWTDARPKLGGLPLTFFETVTVLAFSIFAREGVELAILETGLGGRLDATNVFSRPRATAITKVARDHRAWLGDDLTAIAREKAGILKPGVPCVVGPQDAVVDAVIDEVAAGLAAPVIRPRVGVAPALAGAHQRDNAAVALGVLDVLGEGDPARALAATWPGRLERVGQTLLDVAHNPDGAAALAAHLETQPPYALVFGAMKDKDWSAMLTSLRPRARHVVLTRAELARSEDPAAMATEADEILDDVVAATERARALAGPDGLVVIAGSAFVVAAARAHLLGLQTDPPIAL